MAGRRTCRECRMAVGRAKRLVQNELQSRKSRLFGSDCSIPTARRQNELQRNLNNKMIRYFMIYVTSSGAKIGSYVVAVVVVVGTGGGEVNHHSLFVAHCAIVNAIRRLEGNNHTTTTTTSSQCRIRYDTIRWRGMTTPRRSREGFSWLVFLRAICLTRRGTKLRRSKVLPRLQSTLKLTWVALFHFSVRSCSLFFL